MNTGFKGFLQRWAINTLAVLVAAYVVAGISFQRPLDLLVATLVLGVLNAFVKPIMWFLSLPLLLVTLGLFTLVINAILLLLVSWLLSPKFHVDGFWSAFWGGLIISIMTIILNTLTGTGKSKITIRKSRKGRDDDGPVIDV